MLRVLGVKEGLEPKKPRPPEVERRGWSSERVSAVVEPGVEV